MGDFFDNMVGKAFSKRRARLVLKTEARGAVKAKHGFTDEELDAALAKMSGEMTNIVHKDMAMLREKTAEHDKKNWNTLRKQRATIRARRKKGPDNVERHS